MTIFSVVRIRKGARRIYIHEGRIWEGASHDRQCRCQGRLPTTFARSAGSGDRAVALLAMPIAWLAHRRAPAWWSITLAWNAVACVDLMAAVVLGMGSIPGSPVRAIHDDAVPGTIATVPSVLVPGFLGPPYLMSHLAVFARLLREVPGGVALRAGH